MKNWKKKQQQQNKTKHVMNSLLLNLTIGVVFYSLLGMCRALDKTAILVYINTNILLCYSSMKTCTCHVCTFQKHTV